MEQPLHLNTAAAQNQTPKEGKTGRQKALQVNRCYLSHRKPVILQPLKPAITDLSDYICSNNLQFLRVSTNYKTF